MMEKTVRELAEFLHGKLENDAPELKKLPVLTALLKQVPTIFPLPFRRMWNIAI